MFGFLLYKTGSQNKIRARCSQPLLFVKKKTNTLQTEHAALTSEAGLFVPTINTSLVHVCNFFFVCIRTETVIYTSKIL